MITSLAGHFWTIAPVLRHQARPRPAPSSVSWSTTLADEHLGTVTLRGAFRDQQASDAALIVVHGLGGTTETHYCTAAARAADAAKVACLRLALRGADRDGEDLYHAGMVADLHAAVASPALSRFRRIYVMAFSLGGHVALRYALATEASRDPRVRAVAAICSPLDLQLGSRHIDSAGAYVYRQHILTGLKEMYRAFEKRRSVPTPLGRVLAARTIREWDELTVVPRHGFASVDHYYSETSVGPVLDQLAIPTLFVSRAQDPMVPPWTYRHHLERSLPRLVHRSLPAGGHVGYPDNIDLGEEGPRGVEAQVLTWLARQG